MIVKTTVEEGVLNCRKILGHYFWLQIIHNQADANEKKIKHRVKKKQGACLKVL